MIINWLQFSALQWSTDIFLYLDDQDLILNPQKIPYPTNALSFTRNGVKLSVNIGNHCYRLGLIGTYVLKELKQYINILYMLTNTQMTAGAVFENLIDHWYILNIEN